MLNPSVSPDGPLEGTQPRLPIRCPNCRNRLDVAPDSGLSDLTCVKCGTTFHIVDPPQAGSQVTHPTHVGHFELTEQLGAGAFGFVWKAYDASLDRWVAVKLPRIRRLDPLQEEQLLREARAAAQLKHPSIVSVFEVGRDQDTLYIVSELVAGQDLSKWMVARRPTFRESAEICRDVARALHHAHEAGVVHRDVKPSNIIIDEKNLPHLTDFGLAKRDVAEVTLTVEGNLVGTPTHMSPEQARGTTRLIDCRTDTYALGVILYQLLTDELPFRGNAQMLLHQILNVDPPAPRKFYHQTPRDLETICLKCLEKNPDRRYPTAADLAEDLHRYLNRQPILARPVGRLGRAWRWCQRHQAIAFLGAASLCLLVALSLGSAAFAVVFGRQRDEAEAAQLRTEKILSYLVDAFRSPDPLIDGKDVTVASVLDQATADAGDQLGDDPLGLASLLHALGETYLGLGLHQEAIACAERALEIRERELGQRHRGSVSTLSLLGLACQYAGHTDRAIEYLEKAVALSSNASGEDDAQRLTAITNLANSLEDKGDYRGSLELFREVWRRRRATLGADHRDTLLAMNNVADSLNVNGRRDEALPLLRQTLERMRTVLGDDHLYTLSTMANLAGTLRRTGQVDAAIPIYEEALCRLRARLAEGHATTLSVMNNLAVAYRQTGRLDDALELYEESASLRREHLGEDHPSTWNAMSNLAVCHQSMGQWELAVPIYERVLALRDAHLGDTHLHTLNSATILAGGYLAAGRIDDAVSLCEQTLERFTATLPPDHPQTLICMVYLGRGYLAQGEPEKAIAVLETALDRSREKFGAEHAQTLGTLSYLADAHRAAGRADQAVKLYRDALQRCRATMGDDHKMTQRIIGKLQELAVTIESDGATGTPVHGETESG